MLCCLVTLIFDINSYHGLQGTKLIRFTIRHPWTINFNNKFDIDDWNRHWVFIGAEVSVLHLRKIVQWLLTNGAEGKNQITCLIKQINLFLELLKEDSRQLQVHHNYIDHFILLTWILYFWWQSITVISWVIWGGVECNRISDKRTTIMETENAHWIQIKQVAILSLFIIHIREKR